MEPRIDALSTHLSAEDTFAENLNAFIVFVHEAVCLDTETSEWLDILARACSHGTLGPAIMYDWYSLKPHLKALNTNPMINIQCFAAALTSMKTMWTLDVPSFPPQFFNGLTGWSQDKVQRCGEIVRKLTQCAVAFVEAPMDADLQVKCKRFPKVAALARESEKTHNTIDLYFLKCRIRVEWGRIIEDWIRTADQTLQEDDDRLLEPLLNRHFAPFHEK